MDTRKYGSHREKTDAIARAVRKHAETARQGEYFSLRKAQVSHTVPKPDDPKNRDRKIDISSLTEILEVDPEKRLCTAEAGVPFERLVRETLAFGLIPRTVSELKSITIGGAVAGCSVESMSYKYGGFHDSCTAYEIVTGNGGILDCSREKNDDVFEMIHGSFGTLGILTLLTFELIPAQAYVRTEYLSYPSFGALMKAVREHYEKRDLDFMDAIVHSPEENVLCTGTFTKKAPYKNSYVISPFYRSTQRRTGDFMTTEDYLFRYDADCHWIVRNYGLENPVLRRLLAPVALGSSNILSLAKRFPFLGGTADPPDVVSDVFIPFARTEEFFSWYRKLFDYYPLWIVPYRIERMYPWVNPGLVSRMENDELFIDCAIYGFRQHGGINYYKALEEKVYELGGIKTLITHNYYSEKEFWDSYNRSAYESVKRKTDPKNIFRELYHKTNYTHMPKKSSRARESGQLGTVDPISGA